MSDRLFDGRLEQECLDWNWFLSMKDAREKIKAWHREYNEDRPHTALAYKPPRECLADWRTGISNEQELAR